MCHFRSPSTMRTAGVSGFIPGRGDGALLKINTQGVCLFTSHRPTIWTRRFSHLSIASPIHGLIPSETSPMWKPTTGEPCARKPPARFRGRGGESLPYPYPVSGSDVDGVVKRYFGGEGGFKQSSQSHLAVEWQGRPALIEFRPNPVYGFGE